MLNRIVIACIVSLASGMFTWTASASTLGLQITDLNQIGSVTNGVTRGWSFMANANISVDQLGTWDADSDGLAAGSEVGIWNDDGSTLLASAVFTLGSEGSLIPDGDVGGGNHADFRMLSITPVELTAGNSYVIGSYYPPGSNDDYNHSDPGTGIAITTPSEVSFLQAGINNADLALTFPDVFNTAPTLGRFGPTFTFDPVPVVPEPSTLTLFALGFIALIKRRRRRA